MITILIIDDSDMVREQVSGVLVGAGFQTVEAIDGADALEKLEAKPETRLVICDVNMPRMGGIEFLERIRDLGNRVPVVMLTTEGQSELMKKAKGLGAKGWIVKPFVPGHLVAAAHKLTS